MEFSGIDLTDKKILDIIKDNARLSYSDIGSQIGISRVAVKKHMDAMEERGIIAGYHTIVDSSKAKDAIEFMIDLEILPEQFDNIVRSLNKSPLIRKIYTVSGESKIHAIGMGTDRKVINHFSTSIYNMYGINKFGFHVILDTLKDIDGGVFYEEGRTKEN